MQNLPRNSLFGTHVGIQYIATNHHAQPERVNASGKAQKLISKLAGSTCAKCKIYEILEKCTKISLVYERTTVTVHAASEFESDTQATQIAFAIHVKVPVRMSVLVVSFS